MPNGSTPPNGLLQYSIWYLILGLVLLLLAFGWCGVIFWMTRKRRVMTLNDISRRSGVHDLAALKAKYLSLIDEVYASYQNKETTLRGLHRGLSMAVRYFVFEATTFPAPKLTLADLKKAQYPELSKIITEYYKAEFAAVSHGDAARSVDAAREFVQRWD